MLRYRIHKNKKIQKEDGKLVVNKEAFPIYVDDSEKQTI